MPRESSDTLRRLSPANLSTGIKMLLILTVALLPLGLIALAASIQSGHAKRLQREADARVIATAEARQIDLMLRRGASILRATLALGPLTPDSCRQHLDADASAFSVPIRVALFGPHGRTRCTVSALAGQRLPPPRGRIGIDLLLIDAPRGLRFTVAGPGGSYGVGELPAELIARVLPIDDRSQGIALRQEQMGLVFSAKPRTPPLSEHLTVQAPIAGGQANLELSMLLNPISAAEILLVLLPLLMWVAASAIGWVVVDQLLLRPLAQLQRAVAAYGAGDGPLELPRIATPSQEIRALGDAFQASAAQLAHRQEQLHEGLDRQVRLTREVHHRVKNNLQVVASLINLHARGTEGDVAAAYASIQRRVDALAVVHRNHFAELEENRGVALRSIVAELSANLRATAPAAASHLMITLDMIPAFVSQDVAVPVAFLITEIIELVMVCDPNPPGGVAIVLAPGDTAERAFLSISSVALASGHCDEHASRQRFERIVLGLSRQLRSKLDYDAGAGRYGVSIAIVGWADDAPAATAAHGRPA